MYIIKKVSFDEFFFIKRFQKNKKFLYIYKTPKMPFFIRKEVVVRLYFLRIFFYLEGNASKIKGNFLLSINYQILASFFLINYNFLKF